MPIRQVDSTMGHRIITIRSIPIAQNYHSTLRVSRFAKTRRINIITDILET